MSGTTEPPSEAGAGDEAAAFRHLPPTVALEDTRTSMRGDGPPDPLGERNTFIDDAIHTGG